MTLQHRIKALAQWGAEISARPVELLDAIERAGLANSWFTPSHIEQALKSLEYNLEANRLNEWLSPYPFENQTTKSVGLIMAGNIPLVGFHDLLAVLGAGYKAKIKLSSDDQILPTYLIGLLTSIAPELGERIELVDRLTDFDLVIATGSNNSARYFEYYFGKKPHIIRKNRNSVAIITGNESEEQLNKLGHDIFDYFGLGCRNVSKLYVPENYDVAHFYEGIADHESIFDHFKYRNNYDYNKSLYLINGDKHYDNGFLLLKEDARLASPLAALHYEEYTSLTALEKEVTAQSDEIQCIVGNMEIFSNSPVVPFGQSQLPTLHDYADGINTLDFLADPKLPLSL